MVNFTLFLLLGEDMLVFDRFVFVLVDALRADFVLPLESSIKNLPKMKYTSRMLETRQSLAFLAKAHAPTVTMPRIKVLDVICRQF